MPSGGRLLMLLAVRSVTSFCSEEFVSPAAHQIADRVAQRARGVDAFVQKLEALGLERRLTRVDLERAYAGAFLAFFTLFEQSWEELLFGHLMGRLDTEQRVKALVDIRSELVARSVVRGKAAGYLDWLPAARTVERADIFFAGGRPFSDLTGGERTAIKRYFVLRNALAHQSSHAMRTFRKEVIGQKLLPPHERRPAGYLRGMHAPGQTRFNLALSELSLISRRLCR